MTTQKWVDSFGKGKARGFGIIRIVFAGIFLVSGAFPNFALAHDVKDAEFFVRGIYKYYEGKSDIPDFDQSPFLSPGLSALIDKDASLAMADGEVPYIDGDLFCDCQDMAGVFLMKNIKITFRSNGHIRSDVFFVMGKMERHLWFDLINVAGRWRVNDIASSKEASLRQGLQEDITAREIHK